PSPAIRGDSLEGACALRRTRSGEDAPLHDLEIRAAAVPRIPVEKPHDPRIPDVEDLAVETPNAAIRVPQTDETVVKEEPHFPEAPEVGIVQNHVGAVAEPEIPGRGHRGVGQNEGRRACKPICNALPGWGDPSPRNGQL